MIIHGTHIRLRSVEVSDADFILRLRVDERLNRFLSPVGDDLDHQVAWLQRYKRREQRGEEIYWMIEDLASRAVGTVRLYDFDETDRSFTWGSWILKAGNPPQYALESAIRIYDYGFYTLQFEAARIEVRKGNTGVIAFHKRFAAKPVGESDEKLYYRLEAEDYAATRRRYVDFLNLQEM